MKGKKIEMNWTKEKPIQDGYYWLKEKGKNPRVVNVWDASDDPMIAFCGSVCDKYLKELNGAEWYGPLKPPNSHKDSSHTHEIPEDLFFPGNHSKKEGE